MYYIRMTMHISSNNTMYSTILLSVPERTILLTIGYQCLTRKDTHYARSICRSNIVLSVLQVPQQTPGIGRRRVLGVVRLSGKDNGKVHYLQKKAFSRV